MKNQTMALARIVFGPGFIGRALQFVWSTAKKTCPSPFRFEFIRNDLGDGIVV